MIMNRYTFANELPDAEHWFISFGAVEFTALTIGRSDC